MYRIKVILLIFRSYLKPPPEIKWHAIFDMARQPNSNLIQNQKIKAEEFDQAIELRGNTNYTPFDNRCAWVGAVAAIGHSFNGDSSPKL